MGAREKQKAKSRAAKSQSGKSTPSSAKFTKHTHKGLTSRSTAQDWQGYASSPYSSSPQNGHSLVQEARNTERHTFGWGNSRLRDNAVPFVSAGNLVREEAQSSSQEDELIDKQEGGIQQPAEQKVHPPVQALEVDIVHKQEVDVEQPVGEDLQFTVEAQPDEVQPEGVPLQMNGTPHHDASSSEDEVVFVGRNANDTATPGNAPQPIRQTTIQQPIPVPIPRSPEVLTNPPVSSSSDARASLGHRPFAVQRPRRRWESRYDKRKRREEEEEDAMLQDYIENMAMDDEEDEDDEAEAGSGSKTSAKPQRRNDHFRFHKGDGLNNAKVRLKPMPGTERGPTEPESEGWESADLDDLNCLSTTDDDDDFLLDRVLRHRERPKGRQYLVVAAGMGISDAKWIPHSRLTSQVAVEQIQIYETLLQERLRESVEVSSEEDEDDEDLIDDIGSEQDENERILDRTSRMTDEEIARALAKQEELGMGSEEVKLWNARDVDDLDDDDEDFTIDQFLAGDGFIPFSISKHTSNRSRSKRNKRGRDSFPSAGALADALDQDPYGGFDVMDFDRPSLRPKRKGRKSDFPYDIDGIDEDLAVQLMETWTKDRDKKVARKRERQEEREAFLLESAEGSNPAFIKARIRQFLVSESDTLELTPMDSSVRASVHRLAKALKLHSQSRGKDGNSGGRYPVLTKTPHTPYYTIDTIWEVDALMNLRKFFPKTAYKDAKALGSIAATRHSRGGVAAASYANGEIVGAAAPEIGIENKGRAMLEKMGWSAGMGIGAVGNKGSIDAIKHVVKTNKAGLG